MRARCSARNDAHRQHTRALAHGFARRPLSWPETTRGAALSTRSFFLFPPPPTTAASDNPRRDPDAAERSRRARARQRGEEHRSARPPARRPPPRARPPEASPAVSAVVLAHARERGERLGLGVRRRHVRVEAAVEVDAQRSGRGRRRHTSVAFTGGPTNPPPPWRRRPRGRTGASKKTAHASHWPRAAARPACRAHDRALAVDEVQQHRREHALDRQLGAPAARRPARGRGRPTPTRAPIARGYDARAAAGGGWSTAARGQSRTTARSWSVVVDRARYVRFPRAGGNRRARVAAPHASARPRRGERAARTPRA